jgi:hypothetical protein
VKKVLPVKKALPVLQVLLVR